LDAALRRLGLEPPAEPPTPIVSVDALLPVAAVSNPFRRDAV
jgi:hypothetical protein